MTAGLGGRLGAMAGLILMLSSFHLLAGLPGAGLADLWQALAAPDPTSIGQRLITAVRLPRLAAVLLAGAALGATGYLLQLALRNRFGEPGILGLNAGAGLAVVALTAMPLLPMTAMTRPLIASLGAGAVFALVLLIGTAGRQGAEPVKLVFSGVAFSALANALTSAILILDEDTLDRVRFWLTGDAAGVKMAAVTAALPAALAGFVIALSVMPQMAALALGDTVARGLGAEAGRARVMALLAAALLSGAAVSLVGPIGFIGMIAPALWAGLHARPSIAALLLIALTGAALLVAADLAARQMLQPAELPTGALTGLVGAPVFLWLFARRAR